MLHTTHSGKRNDSVSSSIRNVVSLKRQWAQIESKLKTERGRSTSISIISYHSTLQDTACQGVHCTMYVNTRILGRVYPCRSSPWRSTEKVVLSIHRSRHACRYRETRPGPARRMHEVQDWLLTLHPGHPSSCTWTTPRMRRCVPASPWTRPSRRT